MATKVWIKILPKMDTIDQNGNVIEEGSHGDCRGCGRPMGDLKKAGLTHGRFIFMAYLTDPSWKNSMDQLEVSFAIMRALRDESKGYWELDKSDWEKLVKVVREGKAYGGLPSVPVAQCIGHGFAKAILEPLRDSPFEVVEEVKAT